MKKRIGLIGLGNIGSFYTTQLLKDQYPLTVLDTDAERMKKAEMAGAKTVANPAALAEVSDIIILSLPNSEIVEAIMQQSDGILSVLKKGQLVIDTSTCRPSTAVKMEKLCNEKDAGFIDSPLTWREPGQILMVGGDENLYHQCKDVLDCISYKNKHIGPIGSGQFLKAANQAILACMVTINAEVVEFTKKCGLDPKLLRDYLEFNISEDLYTKDYTGGGHLALHYKDLGYLLEIAHDLEASIPVNSLVHEIFKSAKQYGESNWKQVGVQSYYTRMNNDKI